MRPRIPVLFTRDKDGLLTAALDREIARRKNSGIPVRDRAALVKETLWAAVRIWDDPRRGKLARS